MTQEEKLKLFENELNLIQDSSIKEFAKVLLTNTEDWFYIEPASTSGKYHPMFALGDGGLVRHTKAVVYFINDYARTEIFGKIDEHHRDLLIVAGIAHDIRKHVNGHYVKDHPIQAGKFVEETYKNTNLISEDDMKYIKSAVRSHMGQWYSPKPTKLYEKLVHVADYTASRRDIMMNF